jgi:hypothetical protein
MTEYIGLIITLLLGSFLTLLGSYAVHRWSMNREKIAEKINNLNQAYWSFCEHRLPFKEYMTHVYRAC